ncbi:SDR family oxidoreductase [Jannaschia sp. W003]|uniref:SDR family oxidoreductase n=1 Tax=Jannaschia sp. W003 TaxID=2867012 RepID=UPI0021A64DB5|nr:SDR family oxidoreductase [Jannaschia sp. W003]UWQ21305.1 SDR family NAD(P)-dependent oxidoreductase [Jannaschia sp. W003]
MSSRIAVVAGGSAGVGRAVVDMMCARGWRVAVLARGQERLDEIEALYGDQVMGRACDVSKDAEVAAAADAVVARWGAPDVWVNCAMLTSVSPFEEVDDAEFRAITDTTYLGQVNGTRHALRVMERGNIVAVGSGLGYRSIPFQAAYCGAKAAVIGFMQAVRSELIREGRPITVGMVELPAINTPQFDWARNRLDVKPQPAPPIFQPEVAAEGVMKAIDDGCREVLVGRSTMQLVFANMIFPDLLDQFLAKKGVEMQRSEQRDWGREDNLDGPVAMPSRAHGSFDDRAEARGVAVDADAARKALAFGGAALLVGLGALAGRAFAPSRRRAPEVAAQDHDRPWGYDHPPAGLEAPDAADRL